MHTLQDAVDFLYRQLPDFQRIGAAAYKPGLDRVLALLRHFGNPHLHNKYVHVAGTNGKGSSSHMLAAILQQSGYKVGLYTSPHLKSFTERIKVNGNAVSDDFVMEFVQRVKPVIQDITPSFFEITVCMAFEYFKQCQTDIAIIEVGMGGRLDSTNVILPEVALITNISYDHQKFLGDTLPQIAAEKAGIIKAQIPTVISELQPEVSLVFKEKAAPMHAPMVFASDIYNVAAQAIKSGKRTFEVVHKATGKKQHLDTDLCGGYQAKNIAGVLCAVEVLQSKGWQISEQAVLSGLANVTELTGLKGRWQTLHHQPLTICDTGHNEGGIKEVLENIVHTPHHRLHFVIGMVADKDHDQILCMLPKNAIFYFTAPTIERRLPPDALQQKAKMYGLQGDIYNDVNEAYAAALQNANQADLIFIGGSTFTVADIQGL